jgi:hypothetical protein
MASAFFKSLFAFLKRIFSACKLETLITSPMPTLELCTLNFDSLQFKGTFGNCIR